MTNDLGTKLFQIFVNSFIVQMLVRLGPDTKVTVIVRQPEAPPQGALIVSNDVDLDAACAAVTHFAGGGDDLAVKVKMMRQHQRDFFRTKSRESLDASKRLEREVDTIIAARFDPQRDLL